MEATMKKFFCYRHLISIGFAFIFLAVAPIVIAKTINLYEQPKADSKVVGNIDSSAGIVSIFTTSDGNWIKVGDPRNGNTGWIKSTDLSNKNFNFNLIKTSDGMHQYQVIQYGNTKPLNPEQVSNAIKQMELRQQIIQKDMQRMMQDMFADAQEWMKTRMFVPVFMMPLKETTTKPQDKNQDKSQQSNIESDKRKS